MNNSAAYEIGEVLGVLIVLSPFVFFVVALIRSIQTGRKGWIIGAVISGLPVAAVIILLLVAFAKGISQAGGGTGLFGTKLETAADLMTGSMTPVAGSVIPYSISYPWISSWKKQDTSDDAFDQLYSFHDAYVGVIAEGVGLGTPQRICDLSQKHLAEKATQYTLTTAQSIDIDSRSWLTYDATATVSGVDVKYRFYVYADRNYSFQILAWTGPGEFGAVSSVFDRVAKSFTMPK